MSTNDQVEASASLDFIKWMVVAGIIGAGVYGNSAYAADYGLLERTLALVVMGVVVVLVAMTTIKGSAFFRLVRESRAEIRRVVWPTRQETTQTTLMVVVVVVIMALILWGLDTLFNTLISLVIG